MINTIRSTRLVLLCGAALGGALAAEAEAQVHVPHHAAIHAARMSKSHAQSTAHRGSGMHAQGRGYSRMMNQGHGQQVVAQQLLMTRTALMQAQHDYNGHRARALGHVNHALAAMGHHSNNVNGTGMGTGNGFGNLAGARAGGNGNRNGVGNGNVNGMSQQASDQHLRQALQRLTMIHNHMNNNNSMQAAHHGQARNHIQMAVNELNTALAVR